MKRTMNIVLAAIAVLCAVAAIITRGILFVLFLMLTSGAILALLELNGNHVTRY